MVVVAAAIFDDLFGWIIFAIVLSLAAVLGLVLGGGVTYIGYRYANNTNTVQVPDFARVDMTAAYRQPTYDVRLNVFNLLNTMYYEQVIASDGGRAVAGSGLTAMLTYTHRL